MFHITTLAISNSSKLYPCCRAEIISLPVGEALKTVSPEYSDFVVVFSLKLAVKLPKHIKINNYAIYLGDSKPPLYQPIYSLKPVELKILKIYI